MKYLLVLIVVVIGIWVWRSNRAGEKSEPRPAKPRDTDAAVDMLGCNVCGLHCPRDDAIVGRKGVYCSIQHRDQAEA